jgi:hypothetical protein
MSTPKDSQDALVTCPDGFFVTDAISSMVAIDLLLLRPLRHLPALLTTSQVSEFIPKMPAVAGTQDLVRDDEVPIPSNVNIAPRSLRNLMLYTCYCVVMTKTHFGHSIIYITCTQRQ